jgi:hypothetical protein
MSKLMQNIIRMWANTVREKSGSTPFDGVLCNPYTNFRGQILPEEYQIRGIGQNRDYSHQENHHGPIPYFH